MSEQKLFLAQYGTPKHVDALSKDKEPYVRRASMNYMSNQERNRFLTDPNDSVRAHLAKIGSDEHRDKLIDDPSEDVKSHIVEHGNDKHRMHLASTIQSGRWHSILARKVNTDDKTGLGDKLLANKNLSERALEILSEKNSVAKKHYDKIMNHPNANGDTIYHMAYHSEGKNIDRIINHPHNSDNAMEHIVRHGNPSHDQMHNMMDSPKFGIETKKAISIKGNDDHRDRLLQDPQLAPVVMSNIAIHGNHEHRQKLLDHPLVKMGSTLRYIGYGHESGDPATNEHKERAKRMLRGEE